MKKIISSQEMASYDKYTIEKIGIPSLVLMERAALSCVQKITEFSGKSSNIYVICGPGNNGADGVAIARILKCQGYKNTFVHVLGNSSKYTEELKKQIDIAKECKVEFISNLSDIKCPDLLVDAIFGIGLNRDPAGDYALAIDKINESDCPVLSVDVPSGICSNTGKGYEPHINASYTVTFQFIKKGLLLSQGYISKGELTVADIGILLPASTLEASIDKNCYLYEESDVNALIKPLSADANKGSRGKVLVIAGSESIYGACYLSAKAALKSGCGMVKIYTHKNNIASIQQNLPEAMYASYEGYLENELNELMNWADVILLGPGLSTSGTAKRIVEHVILTAKCPIVLDADGINILADNPDMLAKAQPGNEIVLTPHLKEMSRLCGQSVDYIKNNMEEIALDFHNKYDCSIILKNFTSFIVTENGTAISPYGNQSMATAGSGDVLAGITASLLAQDIFTDDALPLAAYLHGNAGEKASQEMGMRHVIAGDIINALTF